jgi:hypothetical protein
VKRARSESEAGVRREGAGGRATYVPLAVVLSLVLPVVVPPVVPPVLPPVVVPVVPVPLAGGRDLAMYAPIRNATPTTSETINRTRWCPLWTAPSMKCKEFAAPEMYRIAAMIASIPMTARMITSGPRFADPPALLAEVTCSS